MSVLGKLFKGGIDKTLGKVNEVIDTLGTSDDEKLTAKERLADILLSAQMRVMSTQEAILKAEMSGNWWQRSWRPMCTMALVLCLILRYTGVLTHEVDKDIEILIIKLIQYAFTGYIVSRGVEKTTKTISQNMDLSMLRKKDRKKAYKIMEMEED